MNKYYPGADAVREYDNPREMIKDVVEFVEENSDVNIIGVPSQKYMKVGFLCLETNEVWYTSVRHFKRKEYRDCLEIIYGDEPLNYKKHKFIERMRKAASERV